MNQETEEAFKYRMDIARQLWSCSSEQGMTDASKLWPLTRNIIKIFRCSKIFHQGVKNGSAVSASVLRDGFSGKTSKDSLDFLDLAPDEERSRRYNIIWNYLTDNDYLHPKVPDLDEIAPLTPAKLPEWDGKIAFRVGMKGKPRLNRSEALMQKLANQAGLRVDNGLDLETNLPKSVKK